jgi:ADP-ribosylglycohydrolase
VSRFPLSISWNSETMRKSNLWDASEYTDDTQMALVVADSLVAEGELDVSDIAKRFRT